MRRPYGGAGADDGDGGAGEEGDEAAVGFAGEAAGWSQVGPAGGGTTIVGATGFVGRASAGGAHVDATPAVWPVGDEGRTGGALFLRLFRRRGLRERSPAKRAAPANSVSGYSPGRRTGQALS